jgi:hypothetical protein
LVGYDSTNIFRIWLPKKDQVIRVRDLIFKRESRFGDDSVAEREAVMQEEIEILDIPHSRDVEADLSDLIEPLQSRLHTAHARNKENEPQKEWAPLPTPEPSIRGNTAPPQEEEGEDIYIDAQDAQDDQQTAEEQDPEQQLQEQLLHDMQSDQEDDDSTINVRVPESVTTRQGPLTPIASGYRRQPQKAPSTLPRGWVTSDDYIPDRQRNNAPRMADPEVGSSSNIVSGKRARKPTNQALATYYAAFAAAANPTVSLKLAGELPKIRLHRDQLPPPPKRWKDIKNHPFSAEFTQAARTEIDSCWAKDCFKRMEANSATADAEILPLMWVFTYKFDEDGYLYKFKARLCVRGDLQAPRDLGRNLRCHTSYESLSIISRDSSRIWFADVPIRCVGRFSQRKIISKDVLSNTRRLYPRVW